MIIYNIKLKIYTTDKKKYLLDLKNWDYIKAKEKAMEILKTGYGDTREFNVFSVRPEVIYPAQSIQKVEIILEK
jgi:hypothetical protein